MHDPAIRAANTSYSRPMLIQMVKSDDATRLAFTHRREQRDGRLYDGSADPGGLGHTAG